MKTQNLREATPWEQFLARLSPETQEKMLFASRQGRKAGRLKVAWYLVIIPDGEDPTVITRHSFFAVRDALRNSIRTYPNSRFLVFLGAQADIAEANDNRELRYLIHPDGTASPLFAAGTSLVIIDEGYIHEPDLLIEEYENVEVEEEVEDSDLPSEEDEESDEDEDVEPVPPGEDEDEEYP